MSIKNSAVIIGRLPFDFEVKNEGEKNAFVMTRVSVKRSYKPEGEKYYPEDLIPVKVFGPKADFLGKYFSKGSYVAMEGEVRMSDDYTDTKTNEEKKGEMYFHVTNIEFVEGAAKAEGSEEAPKAEKKADKKPAAKTGAKKSPWSKN